MLSPDERARALALRRPEDRASFVATRAALRELVGRRVGKAPAQLIFATGEHGKPFLREGNLHFNVAHCEGHAVIALRRAGPVGVDVENVSAILPERDDMAGRMVSDREVRLLRDRAEGGRVRALVGEW